MTETSLPLQRLHDQLAESFASQIASELVGVVLDPGKNTCEIQSDTWTLHVEGWPIDLAFVALDEDPATEADRVRALNDTLGHKAISSLKDADLHLEGALSTALHASKDAISISLGALLQDGGSA